jgi:UDPglucose--hexose-1-phosphate uridylyltransferase
MGISYKFPYKESLYSEIPAVKSCKYLKMAEFDPSTHPHRRCKPQTHPCCGSDRNEYPVNPLTNEYILVSPHRTKRPWLGQTEAPQPSNLPQYDPDCYLCPGNSRMGGQKNEVYDHTTAFENDFAAVLPPPGPLAPVASHPLLITEPVQGGCDVLCFHPRHDLTLARLEVEDIEKIIEEWTRIYRKRGKQEGIKYVQIFEVFCKPISVPGTFFHVLFRTKVQ